MSEAEQKQRCPLCKKEVDDVREVVSNSGEPFTAVEAINGLDAFSALSVPKELICHDGAYTHFRFTDTGEERLVKIKEYDPRALERAHIYHDEHPQTCNEEGCANEGMACYYSHLHEEPDGWYCGKHAHDAGFCPGCGLFWAGIESFDFSRTGYCENCDDAFEAEFGDDEDYGDDWDDDEY